MPAPAHLSIAELAPEVDVVGFWELEKPSWHRYRVPGHHLLLIIRGRFEAITPTGRLSAVPGDLVCFRPAARNQYGCRGPCAYYQASLAFAAPPRHQLTPWLDEAGPLPPVTSLGARLARARELFEAMMASVPVPGAANRLRTRAAVDELLALVAEAAGGAASAMGERIDGWQRARMRLEADLGSAVRIADLARELRMTPDRFTRGFRQRFGLGPLQARTQARLRSAAQRLRAGDEPIKALARALGFADPNAFTRLFRRHYGTTPSEVRAGISPTAATPSTDMPLNRHLLPPDAGPGWLDRFRE